MTEPTTTPMQVVLHDDETRHLIAELIERRVHQYVETAYRTMLAGLGEYGDEPAQRRAVDMMRNLHLAEPWLPAQYAAVDVLDALTVGEQE